MTIVAVSRARGRHFMWLGVCCCLALLASQVSAAERLRIIVPREDNPQINIDGVLDEALWQRIPSYDDMVVIDPDTLIKPRYTTRAHYFYTDRGLYMGVDLEQPADTLVARLSGRDGFINRDEFGITLDTSGQGLYGYWFSTALGGAVKDGKVAPERNFSSEWDGPWRRATALTDRGWSMEAFLPWSMMAMPEIKGKREMGFWVTRKFAMADERWSSPPLPFTGSRFMSALGILEMENVQPRPQLAVFPYSSYTYDDISGEDEYRAGADLFWRPSSNFQLAATANPDFGAVESDDVVVNLTAFEVFFPDKRLFFLEGGEVFSTTPRERPRSGSSSSGARQSATTFSPTPITLVNTRRIGGAPEIDVPDNVEIEDAELAKPTELFGAVKMTGQNGGFRYGLLTAFEEDVRRQAKLNGQDIRLEQDGRSFGVARLLYETSGRGGRRAVGYIGTLVQNPNDDAVVHGLDTHFLSNNGRFAMDTQFIASDVEDDKGYGALLDFRYVPNRQVQHSLRLDILDRDLDIADLGFIRRNDAIGGVYGLNLTKNEGFTHLRSRRTSVVLSYEENLDGRNVRGGVFLRNKWQFNNLSEVGVELDYFPARWDDRNSRDNGVYRNDERWVAEMSYGTDSAKTISVSALAGVRQEELGDWTSRVAFGATYNPSDRVSVTFDFNYYRRDGWLVYQEDRNLTTFDAIEWQPKLALDVFLSARQQLRLTMQWAGIRASEQEFWQVPLGDGDLEPRSKAPGDDSESFTISRLTAQLRYRWEIAPLSDLFVVYTRGSNLPNQVEDEFSDLFTEALTHPVVDLFVIKLRYRFGR
jgi:uncharacterized protein DUF5916